MVVQRRLKECWALIMSIKYLMVMLSLSWLIVANSALSETIHEKIAIQSSLAGHCELVVDYRIDNTIFGASYAVTVRHIDQNLGGSDRKNTFISNSYSGFKGQAKFSLPTASGTQGGKIKVLVHRYPYKHHPKSNIEGKWKRYTVECRKYTHDSPQLQQSTSSSLSLNVKPLKNSNKAFGNQICPTKVKVVGKLKAGSDINGQAVFVGQTLLNTQAQAFSVKKGQTKKFTRILNLNWSAPSTTTLATGGGIATSLMKQDVQQGLNIVGENSQAPILSVPRKAYPISCSLPAVNPGMQLPNGGLNTLPNHTGGGAPTSMQGNQNSTGRGLPRVGKAATPDSKKANSIIEKQKN